MKKCYDMVSSDSEAEVSYVCTYVKG